MEIEKTIERLKNGKNTAYFGSNTAIYFIKDIDTVLSYISDLEKLINKKNHKILTTDPFVDTFDIREIITKDMIRDKIKEIEENPNNPYQKVMASQIDASLISCLKEILGE